MLEAQAARRGVTSKLDFSGFETRPLKKRKATTNKTAPSIFDPQVSTLPPSADSHLNSPKKMNTLMSDEICRVDMKISSLMHEDGGNDQTNQSNKFKLWGNNFNGLKFLYDHLNATEDVDKVKMIGRYKLTQNINSYLMRCAALTRGLFESGDDMSKMRSN